MQYETNSEPIIWLFYELISKCKVEIITIFGKQTRMKSTKFDIL